MGTVGYKAKKPAVAVIGAGLAGLSAAYYLHKKARVTIFEKEARIGGRVLTSQRSLGEHGAEFFLSCENEPTINTLIKKLGLEPISWDDDWPGYLFRGKFACGDPSQAADALLPSDSAKRVKRLFKLVEDGRLGNPQGMLHQWLSRFLKNDWEAIAFVAMLLAGETCAPANHVTARYGLECLSSLCDDWYSIRGGSQKLVDALYKNSGARFVLNAHVGKVEEVRGGVRVNWIEGRRRGSEKFRAAIVATPDGERLVGEPMRRHFHSYVSVLLEYKRPLQLRANPSFDLGLGLYTDGPINYIQPTKQRCSHVLRILLPNAEPMLRWGEQALVTYCVKHLGQFMTAAAQFHNFSVAKWKLGLPCGGDDKGRKFRRIGQRIFLAGDRFGKWPSMDAAVFSGLAAGDCLAHERAL